jgi:hypothetical protein
MLMIEQVITDYAMMQFQSNKISPTAARFVMAGVYSRFQEMMINNIIAGSVKAQMEAQEKKEGEDG